jgi:phage FluMu gp28-like protein
LEASLPEELKMTKFPTSGKYCHIYFNNGSHIWGIPEGGHIIRSHNPSVLFSDEAAFQPEFGKAFTAALPAITHGGQLIVVSSAEVSEFMQLVEAA